MVIKLRLTVCNISSSPVTLVVLICTVSMHHVLEAFYAFVAQIPQNPHLHLSIEAYRITVDCNVKRVKERGGISRENNEHAERTKTT